jgi:endonuclease YncB( thermonuclease family)
VLAAPEAAAAAKRKITCTTDQAMSAEVASIDDRLGVTLTDGRVLMLAGIDPPGPTPDDPALDQRAGKRLSAWLAGRKILFRALDDRTDRWGRMPALVFAAAGPPGAPLLLVAAAVLDAGLGRFAPVEAARPCRPELLAAEAAARKAKLGLWADPYYAVIAASDRNALYEKTGTSVVVEGEVVGVETNRFRTTLLLGTRHGRDFSVTISQRKVEIFREAELDPDGMKGQILRVRGLLDTRFGPQIEISSRDEIEIVSDRVEVSADPKRHSPAR